MTVSRRQFVADASALGILMALMPELAAAQNAAPQAASDDTPHDSYDFWNGFFDSVNPLAPNYGQKSASRGPGDQLPDPEAETQYLHYPTAPSAFATPLTLPRTSCWITTAMWP